MKVSRASTWCRPETKARGVQAQNGRGIDSFVITLVRILYRKKGSTTANQAMEEACLLRPRNFWQLQYPLGVHGTPISRLIDIDEAGFNLQACN